MPERVKKVEVQVENILSDLGKINVALEKLPNLEHLEKITESLQKITGILGKLTNADESASIELPKGSGSKDYVS
jgi:hypothetical protein